MRPPPSSPPRLRRGSKSWASAPDPRPVACPISTTADELAATRAVLFDADDRHHGVLCDVFDADPTSWVFPWAVLPEVDHLLGVHVGRRAQDAFLADLADGAFRIEWGEEADLERAHELHKKYKTLGLGLVDGVVIAVAERMEADAIATLDTRHFGAVAIAGRPRLLPPGSLLTRRNRYRLAVRVHSASLEK